MCCCCQKGQCKYISLLPYSNISLVWSALLSSIVPSAPKAGELPSWHAAKLPIGQGQSQVLNSKHPHCLLKTHKHFPCKLKKKLSQHTNPFHSLSMCRAQLCLLEGRVMFSAPPSMPLKHVSIAHSSLQWNPNPQLLTGEQVPLQDLYTVTVVAVLITWRPYIQWRSMDCQRPGPCRGDGRETDGIRMCIQLPPKPRR